MELESIYGTVGVNFIKASFKLHKMKIYLSGD